MPKFRIYRDRGWPEKTDSGASGEADFCGKGLGHALRRKGIHYESKKNIQCDIQEASS